MEAMDFRHMCVSIWNARVQAPRRLIADLALGCGSSNATATNCKRGLRWRAAARHGTAFVSSFLLQGRWNMLLEGSVVGLVEDDPVMGGSLVQSLSLEGCHVEWWKTGGEAHAGAEDRKVPIVVICDISCLTWKGTRCSASWRLHLAAALPVCDGLWRHRSGRITDARGCCRLCDQAVRRRQCHRSRPVIDPAQRSAEAGRGAGCIATNSTGRGHAAPDL